MQCTSWPVIRPSAFAATVAGVTLLGVTTGGAGAQSAKEILVVDDALTGKAVLGRFDYVGKWQHVHDKHDGRSNGTSTRSTHVGDVAVFRFTGTRVRLYGVKGPSGGRAGIALDGASTGGLPVDFYAPHVQTHVIFYQSPVLPDGVHNVSVAVWGTRNVRGHYYYVNIDGAETER